MRLLEINDRKQVEEIFPKYRTFYHYFPYLLANETYIHNSMIYADKKMDSVLIPSEKTSLSASIGVTIAPYFNERSVLYDTNYIYDLKETMGVKNFRMNIKKFDRDNSFEFKKAKSISAKKVILDWYRKKKTEDFGYVLWFVDHLNSFEDVHSNIGWVDGEPVAFSLWGELMSDTSVHIISKDKGYPYLQDKMRMETYQDMLEKDFVYCNDAGDCGEHALRVYKLKLRPKFQIPIWSWRKI